MVKFGLQFKQVFFIFINVNNCDCDCDCDSSTNMIVIVVVIVNVIPHLMAALWYFLNHHHHHQKCSSFGTLTGLGSGFELATSMNSCQNYSIID